MIRLVSWNTGGRDWWTSWDRDVDVLLLQEARRPPSAPGFQTVPSIDADWRTAGKARRNWSTAIAAPSGRLELMAHPLAEEDDPAPGEVPISQSGALRVADVVRDGQVVVTVASMYALWERARTGSAIYADASAPRFSETNSQPWSCHFAFALLSLPRSACTDLNSYCTSSSACRLPEPKSVSSLVDTEEGIRSLRR